MFIIILLFVSINCVQSYSSVCLKCECLLDPTPATWIPSPVLINCDGYTDINFNNNLVLPLRASRAIMTNMKLILIPDKALLNSSSLYHLDLSGNEIDTIPDESFALLSNLKYLDLSKNKISHIYSNSFKNCFNLQELLMSRNELKFLPHRFADQILGVETLDVSFNPLGDYFESDGHFLHPQTNGDAPKLLHLKLNFIKLKINEKTNSFSLRGARNLKNLTMRHNLIEVMPNLPRFLEHIDLSQTGIKVLEHDTLPYLQSLHTLIIQDALKLKEVKAHAFGGYPELRVLKLDGCRKLEKFSELAFGRDIQSSKLKTLTMSGTDLNYLGEELKPLLQNLTTFDLSGAPWYCNCSSSWLIPLVTDDVLCAGPSGVSGSSLSNLLHDELLCTPESPYASTQNIVAVLISFGLLFLSIACIYVFCEGARLSRKIFLQKKPGTPGVGSPYGRITVEPNNAEQI